jgi:hypothetical protein
MTKEVSWLVILTNLKWRPPTDEWDKSGVERGKEYVNAIVRSIFLLPRSIVALLGNARFCGSFEYFFYEREAARGLAFLLK